MVKDNLFKLIDNFFNLAKYGSKLPMSPPGRKKKDPEPVAFSDKITGVKEKPSQVNYGDRFNKYLDNIEVIRSPAKRETPKKEEAKLTISPSDRITISDKEFDTSKFILSRDESYTNNKPNAFYYAFGTGWIDHRELTEGNVYSLNLDMPRIFQLDPASIEDFIKKYCTKISSDDAINIIITHRKSPPIGIVVDWRKFKKDYSGMEIKDLSSLKDLNTGLRFLDTVDVNGGFFWDKSALLAAEKIAKIEDGKILSVNPISYTLDEGSVVSAREGEIEEKMGGGEYVYFDEMEERERKRKIKEEYFDYIQVGEVLRQSINVSEKCKNIIDNIYRDQKKDPTISNFFSTRYEGYIRSGTDFIKSFFEKYAENDKSLLKELIQYYFSQSHFALNLMDKVKENNLVSPSFPILEEEKDLVKKLISEVFTLSPEILDKIARSVVYWVKARSV